MKNLLLYLGLAMAFVACEGDPGPPGFDGRDGLDGLDGVNIVAQSFEATLDFEAPDYSNLVDYPNDIEVFEDDMTLIYILWDVVEADDGGDIDVWRLLPQVLYTDDGQYQYNYDFTTGDANIFIDAPGDFDLDSLTEADLENQTFRIVILPAEMASNPNLDVNDYHSVMEVGQLTTQDIIKIN